MPPEAGTELQYVITEHFLQTKTCRFGFQSFHLVWYLPLELLSQQPFCLLLARYRKSSSLDLVFASLSVATFSQVSSSFICCCNSSIRLTETASITWALCCAAVSSDHANGSCFSRIWWMSLPSSILPSCLRHHSITLARKVSPVLLLFLKTYSTIS